MLANINLADPKYYKPVTGELWLGSMNLTDKDIIDSIIPFLNEHPEIKDLNVSSNPGIGADGAKELANAKLNLRLLDLSHCNIGDEGAIALAANLNSNLTILIVINNNIGDEGVIALAGSNLETLNVSRNNIGPKGAIALAASPNLKTVFIDDNNIGDEGAIALAASNLEILYARKSNISDKGAIALALEASPNLKMLNVGENNIGNEGIIALREPDPRKRVNYGRNVNMPKDVPSLVNLCLFAIKNSPQLDQSQLPEELREKLSHKTIISL